MYAQKVKLFVGVGATLFVVISWAVYKALFKRADEDDLSPSTTRFTATAPDEAVPSKGEVGLESTISPPLAFKREPDPLTDDEPEADRSHEIMPGAENSFIEDELLESSVVEEIIAPESVETELSAPPVVINLDDTVTLNSSDLSSGDEDKDDTMPDDSDIVMLDDGDIAAMVAEQLKSESSPIKSDQSFDSDIVEVPIVRNTDHREVNEAPVVCNVDSILNSEPTETHEVPKTSDDLPKEADEPMARDNDKPEVEEEVVQSDSITQLNATLEEIQKSMTSTSEQEPPVVQEEIIQHNVAPQQSAPPSDRHAMDDSRTSDDSLNGCESMLTTDSGIVLSTTAPTTNGSRHSHDNDASTTVMNGVAEASQMSAITMQAASERGNNYPDAVDSPGKKSHSDGQKITASSPLTVNPGKQTPAAQSNISPSPPKLSPNASKTSPKGATNGAAQKKIVYKFLIPEKLCGLFIGKGGRNVSALKHETNTNIKIGREPVLSNFRYCTVEGNERNVQRALRLIKKQYPDVDTTSADQLGIPAAGLTLSSDRMQLHLPMGVLIDVVISQVVNAGHIFVQQPTHPTFNSWQRLDDCMNACYGDGTTSPPLPSHIDDSILCVAPMNGRWYRAQIMSFSEDRSQCEVKLMDVGGYASLVTDKLRQIREDFLGLPFQAVECYLYNIEPYGVAYSAEATEALITMTSSQVVQCQPAAVAENNVPYIHVLAQRNQQPIVVNRELANQGLVKWYNMSE